MKVIKKTDEYTILQKRSERYAVRGRKGVMINGEDKTKILLAEGLITLTEPRPADEAPEESAAEAEAEAEGGGEEAATE